MMKSGGEQANPAKETPALGVPAPGLPYKLGFLLGGAAFAVASYLLGTLLYEMELALAQGRVLTWAGLGHALANIFHQHLLTYIPWVMGATAVSVALGYLFDKQVQYRRAAERLAATDSLTLLATRRVLLAGINREVSRARRNLSNAFSVLMIDIDGFKQYNDSYGHLAGDTVLRNVSAAVRGSLRTVDVAGRFGGEEIVVLLTGTDRNGAAVVAERVRARIETETDVTASIGVASYPGDGQKVEELILAADQAMYRAKQSGKNTVCLAS